MKSLDMALFHVGPEGAHHAPEYKLAPRGNVQIPLYASTGEVCAHVVRNFPAERPASGIGSEGEGGSDGSLAFPDYSAEGYGAEGAPYQTIEGVDRPLSYMGVGGDADGYRTYDDADLSAAAAAAAASQVGWGADPTGSAATAVSANKPTTSSGEAVFNPSFRSFGGPELFGTKEAEEFC
jgi:hypothetical protein